MFQVEPLAQSRPMRSDLKERGELYGNTVVSTVMSNIGMSDQYIGPMDPGRSYGYFTTVLIKRDKEEKA